MKNDKFQIEEIIHEIPWDLFLLADPSREAIEKYLQKCHVYVGKIQAQVVGGYIIKEKEKSEYELMNIAVYPAFQKQGWGTLLLKTLIEDLKKRGGKKLGVGTGTFGYQLSFYQRVGFRVDSIDKDFFLKNYSTPIFENGIQHKDMLRLVLKL